MAGRYRIHLDNRLYYQIMGTWTWNSDNWRTPIALLVESYGGRLVQRRMNWYLSFDRNDPRTTMFVLKYL